MKPHALLGRTVLGIVVLAAAWLGLVVRSAPAKGRYNVLFIVCDDLNCDLGCYGHKVVESPSIDALAKRGIRFDAAFCQYPLCGPSRASFLTGLYPDQTLIRRNMIYLRCRLPNVVTLPQLFRRHGYFAMRIGKLFHYGVPRNIGTGGYDDPESWDYTINPRGRDKDEEALIFSLTPGRFGGSLSWLAADGTDEEQTDGIGATEAIAALREFARNKKPFFLAVGFFRPHTPYVAPKKYFARYDPEKLTLPAVPENYLQTLPKPAQASLLAKPAQRNLDPKLARKAMQAYYASISFVDRQVGRVLEALETTGLADSTIVVLTSDHGYHMGEHGWYQKMTLFENATRVPLIIAVPGARHAGRATRALAEMVDIYPTLVELCGLKRPKFLSGTSQVPVLENPGLEDPPRRSALTQMHSGYTIRTANYRLTQWGEDGKDGFELYDRREDPEELRNVADTPRYRHVREELRKLLRRRIQQARRKPPRVKQTP